MAAVSLPLRWTTGAPHTCGPQVLSGSGDALHHEGSSRFLRLVRADASTCGNSDAPGNQVSRCLMLVNLIWMPKNIFDSVNFGFMSHECCWGMCGRI
ncbi:hypothetical protein SETIT_6G040300v2 [Setaria italica]|uniref:Uncharacterized protein n=1 Tax=Setaria italica TaxID=4555 RepID=A0A368RJK9_SETIT|nr:hypothetical protein SETIT_6G040300v2 [Setaria italica]